MVESKNISAEDKQEYWSSVGILLYLVKHLHPNLANMTREVSKANDDANPVVYKELLHVIKYVPDTKNLGLKIEPMENTNEPCSCDSNYARDPASRRSISASSETDYMALSDAVKEVMLVIQLL